jgi:hypothetical protein
VNTDGRWLIERGDGSRCRRPSRDAVSLGEQLAAVDLVDQPRRTASDPEAIVGDLVQSQRAKEVVERAQDCGAEAHIVVHAHMASVRQWRRSIKDLMRNRRKGGAIEEVSVLVGEKILITGPAGRIAFGLAKTLVGENEVWGIARFSDPAARDEVEALGVTTRSVDLGDGDFGDMPRDFTYLLHIAADFGDDYERGLRVNAEGTGLVLSHCRAAKVALVMSTVTV